MEKRDTSYNYGWSIGAGNSKEVRIKGESLIHGLKVLCLGLFGVRGVSKGLRNH